MERHPEISTSRWRVAPNLFRLLIADVAHRPLPPLLLVLSCAIAAATLWTVAERALALRNAQLEELERQLPTEITVSPSDGLREELRFDSARLGALSGWPEVLRAYPLYERELWWVIDPSVPMGAARQVVSRGRSAAGDPAHRPGRLLWGRGFEPCERLACMVPSNWLPNDPAGARPETLTVRLARSVGGVEQQAWLDLSVVGAAAMCDRPALDLPLSLAADLERWCRGQDVPGLPQAPVSRATNAVPGEDTAGRMPVDPDRIGCLTPTVFDEGGDPLALGAVRAVVFARNNAGVGPVAARLRERFGYETRDARASYGALERAGRRLAGLVMLVLAACLSVSTVAVFGTAWIRAAARAPELVLLARMGARAASRRVLLGLEGVLASSAIFGIAWLLHRVAGLRLDAWLGPLPPLGQIEADLVLSAVAPMLAIAGGFTGPLMVGRLAREQDGR